MGCLRRFTCGFVLALLVPGLCPTFLGLVSTAQAQATGGIAIDPDGLVRDTLANSANGAGEERGAQAGGGNSIAAPPHPRRIVSLRRFENACRDWLAQQPDQAVPVRDWPRELRAWGGLLRIDSVCFDRASGDVWVAGPAEDWGRSGGGAKGQPTAVGSGLDLEDWLIALRYAFPAGTTDDFIGCSIDPTPEGLARFNQVLKQAPRGEIGGQREALAKALGPQTVSLYGVEPRSQFALKLLAADYRLKRLALGHDPAPIPEFRSLPDLLAQGRMTGRFPQTRWWLTPGAGVLAVSGDRSVWQIDGTRLTVETDRAGGITDATKGPALPKAAREFATLATRLFPELARHQPAFAELTQLVGLSLVAELVRHAAEGAEETGGQRWVPSLWLEGERAATATGPKPERVAPLIEIRRAAGLGWILCGSGGVEIRPERLVEQAKPLTADQLPAFLPWPEHHTHWWHDAPR